MTGSIVVFVNEKPVTMPVGGRAGEAVGRSDPALGEALAAGRARLTDGRGIALPPDAVLGGGAIVRVVVSARRGGDDADG